MKRVFFYFFIFLFFYFFISSFVTSVQAVTCTCRTNCQVNETQEDICIGYKPRYCCTNAPTSVPPTATPTSPAGCGCANPTRILLSLDCNASMIGCSTNDNARADYDVYCGATKCNPLLDQCVYSSSCTTSTQCKVGAPGCDISQVTGGSCGGGSCGNCYVNTGKIVCNDPLGYCADVCTFSADCGTSCGPAPTNNPGGTAPVCIDWESIRIESCTKAQFQSDPVGSPCYTAGQSVTLHLNSNAPTFMGFANVALATACSSVSNATYFLNRSAYSTTKAWTLTAGTGVRKVCVAYQKGAQVAKCEARIIIGTAPTATPTNTPTATPTPIPGAWIKLKNTSFLSKNPLYSLIPLVPDSYDVVDDDGTANFIVGSGGGIVGAPAINITGTNANAKTSSPNEYKVTGYTPSFIMNPSSFLGYIKARKQHQAITSLAQITADGVYVWEGTSPLSITDAVKVRFDNYKIVLVSTGQVNINTDAGLDPVNGSLAIIAPTITFTNIVEEANGIFIANNITTGNPANQGLKIIGNLVALESLTNDREWTNPNRPSLFIVFDQQKYIDLLPYLSTANYDWRQIQ